jgi:hypothetical protein
MLHLVLSIHQTTLIFHFPMDDMEAIALKILNDMESHLEVKGEE